MRRWAAVVVNYEAGSLLSECVAALLADRSAGEAEVVVVDNGSTDGSTRLLASVHPDVPVIETGRNLGYGAAANRGITATDAAVVAVCNADVRLQPGAAAVMSERFETEPDLGALGPMVLDATGAVYPSARRVPSLVDAVGHGALGGLWPANPFTRRYHGGPPAARDVDWVSGAAVWLRRDALEAVGGFDEAYFMYVEDVDLCWRLRRAGWRVAFEPGARVEHLGGVSTARHPYRMLVRHHRSLLRFACKRYRGPAGLLVVPTAAAFLTLRAVALCSWRLLRHAAAPLRRAPGR